jgi:hypothetical protein
VYQQCGALKPLELGRNEASLLMYNLPEVCVQNDLWLDSVRYSFFTAFDLSRVQGVVEWEELNLSGRRAVFRFRWE